MIMIKEREDLELYSLVFIFGAIIGSFLNVVILRVPLGESIVFTKSHCLKCNHNIKWYHNIPLFSYLILRGKCAYCQKHFSVNYFFVELLSATISIALFYKLGFSLDFVYFLILFYILIVLAFIDFKYKAVPDTILLLAFIMGFVVMHNNILFAIQNAFMFAGAFVLLNILLTFYIQNIKAKLVNDETLKEQEALGEGDIPIIAIIGAILGIKAGIMAIFLAAIFAIIPAVYNIKKNKDRETPFIPYLLFGLMIEYLFEISKVIL